MRDITFERFGRLTALEAVNAEGRWTYPWMCMCDCGNYFIVDKYSLTTGNTRSCGCLHREAARKQGIASRTHNMSKTPTYHAWESMIRRCTNSSQQNYARYGGKGITVCKRWRTFANFLEDMGIKPDGTSLDRYPDTNGNYEPSNCRWATTHEQMTNRNDSIWLEYQGVSRHLTEWEQITGINRSTIMKRLKLGWTVEKARTTPVRFKAIHPV